MPAVVKYYSLSYPPSPPLFPTLPTHPLFPLSHHPSSLPPLPHPPLFSLPHPSSLPPLLSPLLSSLPLFPSPLPLPSSPSPYPSYLPLLFLSSPSFRNKSVYLQLGLQKMISKTETSELHRHINIFVDKKKLELPELEGVVVLNIQR